MPTWKHKDVEITLDEGSAYFFAVIDGKKVRASSLQAMKDKLEKRATSESFEVLHEHYGKIDVCRIVDVKRGDYIDTDGRTHSSVTRNTPENRKLIEGYLALKKKNDAEVDRLKRENHAAYDAIPRERPS